MSWSDHVHPHGPITQVLPGFWEVQGSLPSNPVRRNMHLWTLPDGGLVIHSAVALDASGMAELEALGTPSLLIVPCALHRTDAGRYKERYPDLQVLCPKAATAKVEQVVAVEGDCEQVLPGLGIACHRPAGLKPFELHYQVPLTDGGHVLVVTDALFNHEDVPGFGGWFFKHITASTGHFGISRLGKFLLLKQRQAYADYLRAWADDPQLRGIVVGHGDPVIDGVADRLRGAASRV